MSVDVAGVYYPTDSGLLAKAVKRISATGKRIQVAGGATRTSICGTVPRLRGNAPTGSRRSCGCAARRVRKATVRRIAGELAALAEKTANDAQKLLVNAHRALRRARAKAEKLAADGGR